MLAPGSVTISNSELTNNSAYYGGAIDVYSGNVSIFNSKLIYNSADYDGGVIYAYSGIVSISNSELTNNVANEGGAIDVLYTFFHLDHQQHWHFAIVESSLMDLQHSCQ